MISFVLIYFSIFHCLPCKLLSCCWRCGEGGIESCQKRRLERVKKQEEQELIEDRKSHQAQGDLLERKLAEIINKEESLTADDIE